MSAILNFIVKIFRIVFKIKVIILNCVSKTDSIITHIGGTDNNIPFFLKKEKLIIRLRAYERWGYIVRIKTNDGTKVKVVSKKYFRTLRDADNMNNLDDLPTCKEI